MTLYDEVLGKIMKRYNVDEAFLSEDLKHDDFPNRDISGTLDDIKKDGYLSNKKLVGRKNQKAQKIWIREK